MKSLIIAAASIAAFQTLATEFHWRGGEPGTVPNGEGTANLSGDWHTADNWTDASGSPIGGYPHQAGDVAVFHGLAMGGKVYVKSTDVINLGELRFEEGHTTFVTHPDAQLHVAKAVICGSATFGFMADSWGGWDSVEGFTIGNAAELLVSVDGQQGVIRGAMNYQNQSAGNWAQRKSLGIDGEGKVLTNLRVDIWGDAQWVDNNQVNDNPYGLFLGGQGIRYNKPDIVYTVPSAKISEYANAGIGSPLDKGQGVLGTGDSGEPLFFWPNHEELVVGTNYFRARLDAPAFIHAGYGCTVLYDDHSSETNDYYVSAGILRLGGAVRTGEGTSEQWPCKFGSGDIHVAWSGTLEFGCNDVMPKKLPGCIYVDSYGGNGNLFGKIVLGRGIEAKAERMYVDGRQLRCGKWGSSAAKALDSSVNVNDSIFSGEGILTIPSHATIIRIR